MEKTHKEKTKNPTNSYKREKKDNSIENKDPRYNESEILRDFLKSKNGIKFLIDATKTQNFSPSNNIMSQIDHIIDFYTTWASSVPVRKNLKLSKYEFLKSLEDFCSKGDMKSNYKEYL